MSIQSCEFHIVPRPRKWELKYTNTDPSKVQITRKKSSYKMPRIKSSVCLLMQNNVLYPLVQKKSHNIRCKIPICLLQKSHASLLALCHFWREIRCGFYLYFWAPCMALCGHLWPIVALCGPFQLRVWPFVAICGPLWPFSAPCVALCGHLRPLQALQHGQSVHRTKGTAT